MTNPPPPWPLVGATLVRELGEPIGGPRLLSSAWRSRATWAVRGERSGELVVKLRNGDYAYEKTQWCAGHLPLLAARGYPVPTIVWHGPLRGEWHATVQRRLPGRPLVAPGLAEPVLAEPGSAGAELPEPVLADLLRLVELQANAGVSDSRRDFAGYVAHVLFDDWDEVWDDAARACPAAAELCAWVRRWLQPVWGLRLPPADYANNDLNLSNVLTDGTRVTGVVDWDEFGLGSRALDLVVLAFDCHRLGYPAAARRVFARAAEVAGPGGLRCLASYRALGELAHDVREATAAARAAGVGALTAILHELAEFVAGES